MAFIDYVLEPGKPGQSGLSDVVWDMASELTNQGHDAHIVASYDTNVYPDSRVTVHNFLAPPFGYRNVLGNVWLLQRAARVAQALGPDIIHTPEYVSTAIFATLGVKTPLVLTVPGNIFHRLRYGHSYERHYIQVLKWSARVSARHCARVIAISREMRRWWMWTGCTDERTPFIPLGVDHRRFFATAGARRQLDIGRETLYLLYVGRFAQEKGLMDLLRAVARARVRSELARTRIDLLGDGPQAPQIRSFIERAKLEGIVTIHPWVARDQLRIWYSAADALLLPSRSEGFSRTVAEAMICGTPVIGSRITGTEDHVRPGENGLLFPAGDVEALRGLLAGVTTQPQVVRAMRDGAASYARSQLTWESVMQRVIRDVYVPVVRESQPGRALQLDCGAPSGDLPTRATS